MSAVVAGRSHWDVVIPNPSPLEIEEYKALYEGGLLGGVIWFGSGRFVVMFNWATV